MQFHKVFKNLELYLLRHFLGNNSFVYRATVNNEVRNIPKHNSPKTCQAQHCDVSGEGVGNELDHVMLSKYRNEPIGKDHSAPIGETSNNTEHQ